jgi:hypothetical protein
VEMTRAADFYGGAYLRLGRLRRGGLGRIHYFKF